MHEVLAHVAALLCLVAAGLLPGYALERALLRSARLDGLRALARMVLGAAAWMLALFVLAAIGALRPGAVLALALLFAMCAAFAFVRFGRAARREAWGAGFAAAAALAASPFWLAALDYRVAWDAASYHLALPRRYLAAGGFDALPFDVYAVWPHAGELLFAAAMLLRDYPLATALHGVFGALALWAAYLGCAAAGRPFAGWLAAPLALANPVLAFELGVAYVDLVYAFFFTAGVVFLVRALRERPCEPGALALAGVCGGALCGVKVTGVLGAGVLAALALPRGWRRTALAFGGPCLVLWLPWLLHSVRLTGNPVYPFLSALFPTPDWSAALGEQFARWQRGIGMGRGALDYALLPVRVLTSGGPDYGHFGGRLGIHWLPLVPLAAWLGRREQLVRVALAACALYFAAWALGSQQMRFLIPLLPPLAMACAFALDAGLDRLDAQRRPLARALAGAGAIGVAALAVHAHYAGAFSALRALRADAELRRAAAEEPVFRWANRTLPADARVLLLDTNLRFFLERDALADSFFEASQLADWLAGARDADAAAALLRGRGVTHVLWDRRRDWGIRWPEGLRALLADGERAPRRWRSPDGRVEVFELALGSSQ